MTALLGRPLDSEQSLHSILKRPEVTLSAMTRYIPEAASPTLAEPQVAEQLEIQTKYQGYVDRQRLEVDRAAGQEGAGDPFRTSITEQSGACHTRCCRSCRPSRAADDRAGEPHLRCHASRHLAAARQSEARGQAVARAAHPKAHEARVRKASAHPTVTKAGGPAAA